MPASSHEMNHFQFVAVGDRGLVELAAFEDAAVELDGHSSGVDSHLFQQGADGHGTVQLTEFAVDGDVHIISVNQLGRPGA